MCIDIVYSPEFASLEYTEADKEAENAQVSFAISMPASTEISSELLDDIKKSLPQGALVLNFESDTVIASLHKTWTDKDTANMEMAEQTTFTLDAYKERVRRSEERIAKYFASRQALYVSGSASLLPLDSYKDQFWETKYQNYSSTALGFPNGVPLANSPASSKVPSSNYTDDTEGLLNFQELLQMEKRFPDQITEEYDEEEDEGEEEETEEDDTGQETQEDDDFESPIKKFKH
jgi:hypothetical protein